MTNQFKPNYWLEIWNVSEDFLHKNKFYIKNNIRQKEIKNKFTYNVYFVLKQTKINKPKRLTSDLIRLENLNVS